jgi:hypothetical protein
MTLAHGGAVGLRLDWRVRPVLGDHRLLGKSPEARGSRTPGPKLHTRYVGWWYAERCRAAKQYGWRGAVPACVPSSRCLLACLVSKPMSIDRRLGVSLGEPADLTSPLPI